MPRFTIYLFDITGKLIQIEHFHFVPNMHPKKKVTPFQEKHCSEYGLQISGRDRQTNVVNSVTCLLCVAFGREDDENNAAGRKRKQTQNIKYFTGPNFRPCLYDSHILKCHQKCYQEYKVLSAADKKAYLKEDDPQQEKIGAHYDRDEASKTFFVDKPIVDVLLGEVLLNVANDNEEGDEEAPVGFRDRSLAFFKKEFVPRPETEEVNQYKVVIKATTQFVMTVGFVAIGLSFRQAARAIQISKDATRAGQIGAISEKKVGQYVRFIAALNYVAMAKCLAETWAFTIALDSATHMSKAYVDVRLRFYRDGDIHDHHAMLIPLEGAHTGLNIFEHICQFLDVLCVPWRNKLIGVSSDGTANMTGRLSGTVTRFLEVCLPHCYRVWCVLHQLDIFVQEAFKGLLDGLWLTETTATIGHLRRQYTLIENMGVTCPFLVTTRWLCMGAVVNFMYKHRVDIEEHYDRFEDNEIQESTPHALWWIVLIAVKLITEPINQVVEGLQGQKLIISQASASLEALVVDLCTLCSIEGPLDEEAFAALDEDTHLKHGNFAIKVADLEDILLDTGGFANTKWGLLDQEAKVEALWSIAQMMLTIVDGLYGVSARRDALNAAVYEDPAPVRPQDLMDFGGAAFGRLVEQQRPRLTTVVTDQAIAKIEDEHAALKALVRGDPALRAALADLKPFAAFKESWETTGLNARRNFPILMEFAGGLACPFPATATVESDFSIVRWEKDNGRGALENLSLEGIMQCKQHKALWSLTGCDDVI